MAATILDSLTDVHDVAAIERLLAHARVLVAVALLLTEVAAGSHHAGQVGQATMTVYLAFSLAFAAALWLRPDIGPRHGFRVHAADMAWAAAATALTGGPGSNLVPLFAFVLIEAAYRWGLRATLASGGVALGVLGVQGAGALAGWVAWDLKLDLFVMRTSYLAILAVLFGMLSEQQVLLRRQASALGLVLTSVGRETAFGAAMRTALGHLIRLAGARAAALALVDADRRRVFVWRARPVAAPETISLEVTEVDGSQRDHWLPPWPPEVVGCELIRSRSDPASITTSLTLGDQGYPLAAGPAVAPGFAPGLDWQWLSAIRVDLGEGWRGCLLLIDPSSRVASEDRLRALWVLARQLGPSLLNLHLMRQIRSWARTREQARMSRELHDGVIQALAGLEMQVDVLRREAEHEAPALAPELRKVQDGLHAELVELRDLMLELRPLRVDARTLRAELSDLVARFARTSAIDAALDWATGELDLSPRDCRELVRCVQEALVNVRKHSEATRAIVRVEADADGYHVLVRDNGRGFGFTGRWDPARVDAEGVGPRVLRERAAAIGGKLALESSPNGACVRITLPASPER